MHFRNATKFGQFHEEVFIENQKVLQHLFLIDDGWSGRGSLLELGQALGVAIEMLDQEGGAERRLVVESGTSIGMAAGTNLIVERTID